MDKKHIDYILRDRVDNDNKFIYNSFLRSNHDQYPNKFIPDSIYFPPQSKIIENLIASSTVLVACFPEEPDEIIGYMIYDHHPEHLVIHYIYVKLTFRNTSVATSIVNQIIDNKKLIIATHICDNFNKLKHKINGSKIVYNPYK